MQGFSQRRAARGITLVDSMVALTITSILLALAAPPWTRSFKTRKLLGNAHLVAAAVQFARSEAVARNRNVSFSVIPGPAGRSCHIIHIGPAAGCTCRDDGTAACAAGTEVIQASLHDAGVLVAFNGSTGSMRFDPRNGTVTPTATLRVTADNGVEVQHRINIMGRLRSCSPDGAVAELPHC